MGNQAKKLYQKKLEGQFTREATYQPEKRGPMSNESASLAQRHQANKKALRCANSERAKGEEGSDNLRFVPTTPGTCAQLSPLAADLEGLAVSLGVLAGNVSSEQWEFLKIFRANLRSAAERVAALENSLEVPREQA